VDNAGIIPAIVHHAWRLIVVAIDGSIEHTDTINGIEYSAVLAGIIIFL
jgi:hypothetical protein